MLSSDNNDTVIRLHIRTTLTAQGYNVTNGLVNQVLKIFKKNGQMDPNNTIYLNETEDCGGRLKVFATSYASEYHFYCSVIICVLGIVANCLNIIVLTRKEMAAVPINRILTALAWADMLLMVEYIPFTIYDKVDSEEKALSYRGAVYVLFHIHVTQFLHTTSICLTLTLAIWRFLAIRFREKNHVLCSPLRCTVGIAASYVLPFLLCLPQYATFKIESIKIKELGVIYTLYRVGLSDIVENYKPLLKVNFWTYSIFLKLLPCVILIVISLWLIRTLFKAKRGRRVLKSYDSNLLMANEQNAKKQSKYEKRADRTTKMLVAILFLFLLTELPQGLFALVIALKGKELFLTCYQHYGEIMDICAILNGSINFILYCCMNRMFRITFGQLFRSKILKRWTQPTNSDTFTVVAGSNKTITTTM
ncbi:G-protein coupled receptor dmsr-1-like [Dendroctonus ponderosae]|uniref:G-protein coupled receptors family 1 profile domain-containing protein n=2 Tax=Dendroctonus ponderosae TaxID=77166 RepID=A0AAR5PB36_DENPD|nr:G-protein coupled receptor dmsr-1 [Dendroctonus ponderosae]XP_048519256.1 G-protein coupled receptor dmsr-1-like [Dendroctonus ponderosae]XP_048519261.1 G-protein coupled receptor dmsr-1-like [Dendroctonus ponderosae]KAH1007259.1 hypothetical protein HUJ04_004516 [Dendroctonus ponderosae]